MKRVTITISDDILERIDGMIDKKEIKNRSHAIERLIIKAIGKCIDTALILCGGKGIKINNKEFIKPLIPVHRKPILEHQIKMLEKNGIKNIFLSIESKDEGIIKEHIERNNFNADISYIKEKRPLGSAGPITMAKDFIKDSFAMINVDTLINPNIKRIYDFHKKQNTTATVLLVTVDDPSKYGVVRMRGNQILEFIEKPKVNIPSRLINAGFHIFEPDVFRFLPTTPRHFMIEDLFKRLTKANQLSGYPFDGRVIDVGTVDGFRRANKIWR